jgi:DNA-binding MarR family transcriptional regulator
MDALRRIVRGLSASARTLPGGSSVSGAQRFVLRQIAASPGLGVGELAARTLAGQSTVSEVVARLVERGLVSRRADTTDARRATLTLTVAGRRVIADLEPTTQERLADGLATLPVSERSALARALEDWLDAAGLGELQPTMFLEERPAR